MTTALAQPADEPALHTSPAAKADSNPTEHALLADPVLALLADNLDDLERTRIANENRLRQLTRNVDDIDGQNRGFGLTDAHPVVAQIGTIVANLATLENGATLALKQAIRRHPLGPWIKTTKGVGEKQGARLLAAVGDPYWNTLYDRPRTVSELWAYCGLHTLPADQSQDATQDLLVGGAPSNVAARRRKGQRANWSANAKMRAYLVATSCVKVADSPYRAVYLARREHTAITHPDWPKGHSHNDGLRITSKAVLKDLWIAARDLHNT